MKSKKLLLSLLSLIGFSFSSFVISSCDGTTSESESISSTLPESEISSEEISSESIPSVEESSPSVEVHEHTWNDGEVTIKSTCTTDGEITYTCTSCNESKVEVVKANGHVEVIDEKVEPTCLDSGLTEGKHCSECNEVLVAQEVIEAKGHNYVDGVCSECDDVIITDYTEGLKFSLSYDETYYSVSKGTATAEEVIIPSSYQGLPVSEINYQGFSYYNSLTSITIPSRATLPNLHPQNNYCTL